MFHLFPDSQRTRWVGDSCMMSDRHPVVINSTMLDLASIIIINSLSTCNCNLIYYYSFMFQFTINGYW